MNPKSLSRADAVGVDFIAWEFANDGDKPEFTMANEINLEADGWAQLFPFDDAPGKAVVLKANGAFATFDAIQRLDRSAAEQMVTHFNSITNRVKRFVKGVPIFNGHPDMPDAGNKYPDKKRKGLIADLQIRDDGLYCKPIFDEDAVPILTGPKKLFFSGRWSSDELAEENGVRVFRPDALISVGITPNPNLRVQQLNDKNQNQNPMKKIIARLNALGITVANDATEDAVDAAVGTLADQLNAKVTTATTEKATLANDKTTLTGTITARDNSITQLTQERDTARTNFANERKSRIGGLLDGALADGRITASERPQWETRLAVEANFANESEALSKLGKKIKTVSITDRAGERKIEIANASARSEAVQTLVNAEMESTKCSYDVAHARVQKNNPALFAEMKHPEIKRQ